MQVGAWKLRKNPRGAEHIREWSLSICHGMTSKPFLHKFVDQTKTSSFPFSTTLLRSLTEVFNCHCCCCCFILLNKGTSIYY